MYLICFWSCDNNVVDHSVDFDCQLIMLNVGESCDDEDPNTVNDVINTDCNCQGEINFEQPPTIFKWPLKQSINFDDYSYYYLSNYVDHDNSTGTIDYNGGDRTYDGHKGTDIVAYPFWWKKQLENQVEVIAAASGTIIEKDEGHFDQSCSWSGGISNRVKLEHPDGTTSSYLHLKKNSVTTKSIGEKVTVGEFLGHIGSSGISDKPHLHFEVRSVNGDIIDPFQGQFNNTTDSSWWANQPDYYDSGINKIVLSSINPDITGDNCPTPEQTHAKINFVQGEEIIFTRYYRHSIKNEKTICIVYRPDGTVWDSWEHNLSETGRRWYAWNSRSLSSNAQKGNWLFEVTYMNTIYTKNFNVL